MKHEIHEHAHDIYIHLQELYGEHLARRDIRSRKELFRTCMTKDSSVHDHGLKMIRLIERFESLRVVMDNEL